MISQVLDEHLDLFWPQASKYIQRCLTKEGNRVSIFEARKLLDSGQYKLWVNIINIQPLKINAALMATIDVYDQSRVMTLHWLGGENRFDWLDNLAILKQWGYTEQCDEIQIIGRKGWRNAFKKFGFKHCYNVYKVDLDGHKNNSTNSN